MLKNTRIKLVQSSRYSPAEHVVGDVEAREPSQIRQRRRYAAGEAVVGDINLLELLQLPEKSGYGTRQRIRVQGQDPKV